MTRLQKRMSRTVKKRAAKVVVRCDVNSNPHSLYYFMFSELFYVEHNSKIEWSLLET